MKVYKNAGNSIEDIDSAKLSPILSWSFPIKLEIILWVLVSNSILDWNYTIISDCLH